MPIGLKGFQRGNKLPRMLGKKHSLESRAKMSLSGKGRIFTAEHIANMRVPKKNKRPPFTDEHLKKLSEAHKGKPAWNKGKHISEETRKKISDFMKSKNNPNLGRRLTKEHKQNISEARKRLKITSYWKNKVRPEMMGKNNPSNNPIVRKKISDSKKGEKNPNWKGGISPKNILIRNSSEMRLWRKSVFERDNYTCIWCGARNGNGKAVILHADHIKPFCDYPELRFAIDNGRTLCIDCHKKTSSYGFKKSIL